MSVADRLAAIPLLIGFGILVWDILLAGWIATRRSAPRAFTMLTSWCGLLVAPALLIAVATSTDAGARTVIAIAWIWPLIVIAFAIQVAYAIMTRLVSPVVGVPLLLYDIAVAAVALGDYLVSMRGMAPVWLQSAVAARDAIVGFSTGRTALYTPLSLLVPMIAPAFPARLRSSAAIRALLTLTATAVTTLLIVEWPRGYGAVASYNVAFGTRLQERIRGDFAIGVRVFPSLNGAPSSRDIKADMALVEQLNADAVLVVLDQAGMRNAALDSIARVLEPMRVDSSPILVAIEASAAQRSTPQMRAQDLERVLQRLRPDIVFPALLPSVPRLFEADVPTAAWWRNLLVESGKTVDRVRPRTLLGWSASRVDATDSSVYAWASTTSSPVKVLGVVSYPSFAGLPAVNARLRTIDRWRALAVAHGAASEPHWMVTVGGFPHAHGDAAQSAAIMQALAWGTERPWVAGAIIGEASDYDGGVGLRAANGRVRPVVQMVSRAARGLRETSPLGR